MTELFFWSAMSGAGKHADRSAMKLEDNSPACSWNERRWIPGKRALRFLRFCLEKKALLDTPSSSSNENRKRLIRYQFVSHYNKKQQRCFTILCTFGSSVPRLLISRESKNTSVRDLPLPRLPLFPLMVLPGGLAHLRCPSTRRAPLGPRSKGARSITIDRRDPEILFAVWPNLTRRPIVSILASSLSISLDF